MRTKAALLMVPLVGLALTAQQQAPVRRRPAARTELSGACDGARQSGPQRRAPARLAALARYREQNRALAAPAASESRVVFMGDSITDAWPQPRFGDVLRRQAVCRPRHQRADDAADAHPLPSRRHRPEAEGRRHPGRHQRHRREHRPDDQRRDSGQPHVDGGDRHGQRRSASSFRASSRSARITRRRTACHRRCSGRWPASARSTTG